MRKVVSPPVDEIGGMTIPATAIRADGSVPLFMSHNYRIHSLLGVVDDFRVTENGYEGTVRPRDDVGEKYLEPPFRFGIAGRVVKSHKEGDVTVIDDFELVEVSVLEPEP